MSWAPHSLWEASVPGASEHAVRITPTSRGWGFTKPAPFLSTPSPAGRRCLGAFGIISVITALSVTNHKVRTFFNSLPKGFTLLSHRSCILGSFKCGSSYQVSKPAESPGFLRGEGPRGAGAGFPADRPTCVWLTRFETRGPHSQEVRLVFPERKSPMAKVTCLFLMVFVSFKHGDS